MLVLTRKAGEEIDVGDDVRILFLGVEHGVVKVGIIAPPEVPIVRPDAKRKEPKRDD